MINLQIIIDGMQTIDEESSVYFDRETNDIVYLSPNVDDYVELNEMIDEDEDDRFIPLPSQREINEYGMMEDFIDELPDGDQKYTLSMAINGRGAFRRFKDTVRRFDLDDKWYAFRDKCYARVARRWCEENDVEYYQKGSDVPLEELLEDIAEDEPMDVVKVDAQRDPEAFKDLLATLLSGVPQDVEVSFTKTDTDDDGSISPGEAAKLHNLMSQLNSVRQGLDKLASEIENEALSKKIASAASDLGKVINQFDSMVGEGIDISIDDNTPANEIVDLTEMLRRMKEEQDD